MSSIQDIHALEERIYDYVEDHIGGRYNEDDVLAIGRRCSKETDNDKISDITNNWLFLN